MSDLYLTGEFTILEKHVFLKDDMGNDIALCLIEKEKFEPWHEGLVYLPQPVRFWSVLNLRLTEFHGFLCYGALWKDTKDVRHEMKAYSVNGFQLQEIGYGGNILKDEKITAFKVKPNK